MSFENKVYKVATILRPPFVMYNGRTKKWSGLIVDYMEKIASQLGMKYAFQEIKDKKYGYLNEKGRWNGLIGEIVRNKSDFAFAGLSQTADRSTVVDFTDPFYDSVGFSVLMKSPRSKTKSWGCFINLDPSVWLTFLAAYFITSIIIWFVDTCSPYSYRNRRKKYDKDDDTSKRVFTVKESLWYCFTAVTPQGGGDAPKCFAARITSASWWLFGFIYIASYTANMASNLTLPEDNFLVESYSELLSRMRIQYGPVSEMSADHYYRRMAGIETILYEEWRAWTLNTNLTEWEKSQMAVFEYPIGDYYSKMYTLMVDNGLPSSLTMAVSKLKNAKNYALIAEQPDVQYIVMTTCGMQMLPDNFAKKPFAIAVPKRSPLKHILNAAISNLSNTDFLDRLKKKWWDNNPERKTCKYYDDRIPGLVIGNINGMFIFLAGGVIIAYASLLLECAYYNLTNNKFCRRLEEKLNDKLSLKKMVLSKWKKSSQFATSQVQPLTPVKVMN